MKKYNLSEIMKNAWAAFRATGKKFADCLHDAWCTAKMLAMGNLWEKYGKSRIYFCADEILEGMGIEIFRYKTGNVCSCTVNGERVSNADGRRYLQSADGAYYDLKSKKLFVSGCFSDEVKAFLRKKIGF